MKRFFTLLFIVLIVSLKGQTSLDFPKINDLLESKDYDEVIKMLNNASDEDKYNLNEVINSLYMRAYYNLKDYKKSYEYFLLFGEDVPYAVVKEYGPILKLKNGITSIQETKKSYDDLINSKDGIVNYLSTAFIFYVEYDLLDQMDLYLEKIDDKRKNDHFFLLSSCIKAFRNSDYSKSLDLWWDINRKSVDTYTVSDYNYLFDYFNNEVLNIQDILLKSIYLYIKGDIVYAKDILKNVEKKDLKQKIRTLRRTLKKINNYKNINKVIKELSKNK